ncbi:MAG: hydroxyethylthiazole kinase-like uncharacterized protein yjeF [Alphaproteobacteria bacterium]|jgi:hydroxyethylthiazole kinase-like uncharacterized protein yjeF
MLTKNTIDLWKESYPIPDETSHKYTRGHAVIVAGKMVGAARLASRAARRVGAGLVTVVCEPNAYPILTRDWPGTIVSALGEGKRYTEHLVDDKKNAFLLGPGGGLDSDLKAKILYTLEMGKRKGAVIDADGLNIFKADIEKILESLHSNCVITPHAGEFTRIFPDITGSREKMAMAAATRAGCVVVLKGAKTIIASPCGQLVENDHTSPYLATGGTGDVLAGMIVGFMALGVSAFDAANMAVWLHGDAGKRLGIGLVAEDIIDILPTVLREVFEK